eukprot:Sspe_Gene.6499::Locus_2188_Transcript_1_1_Confidence_1.000_Length_890::g.6499::m.6499
MDAQTFRKYDYFLFDCDGVLWAGSDAIPGAAAALRRLHAAGKKMAFISNNSTKSRAAYVRKLKSMGVDFVTERQIFSSAVATSRYLKSRNISSDVYVIGTDDLHAEVQSVLPPGCRTRGREDGGMGYSHDAVAVEWNDGRCGKVGAVVVGNDFEVNMRKVAKAALHLRYDPSCLFVSTNIDGVLPVKGVMLPEAHATTAAVEVVSGRSPDMICGKPHRLLFDIVCSELGVADPARCIMIGDRLDTDIAFGVSAGIDTVLVLSGYTTKEMAAGPHTTPTTLPT